MGSARRRCANCANTSCPLEALWPLWGKEIYIKVNILQVRGKYSFSIFNFFLTCHHICTTTIRSFVCVCVRERYIIPSAFVRFNLIHLYPFSRRVKRRFQIFTRVLLLFVGHCCFFLEVHVYEGLI